MFCVMTFLNVTICTNSILAAIRATEVVSWGETSCSAELSLLCFPPGWFIVPRKYRYHLKGTRPSWCVFACLSEGWCVCGNSSICTPSFLLCSCYGIVPFSNKAVFKGCLVLQGKPDRRGYLPVRKAALLGVQSGAAAMCWVSFTPSFARRSMFGVLKTQPTLSDIIQRVFKGMGRRNNILIFILGSFFYLKMVRKYIF